MNITEIDSSMMDSKKGDLLFELFPTIEEVANKALAASIADLGTSCILADIASMQHETLKTRIFRS